MAEALRLSRDTDIEALAEAVEGRDNFPQFVGTGTQPIYWKRTDLGIVQEFLDRHRDKLRRVVDIALSDRDGFAWWCGTHWVIGVMRALPFELARERCVAASRRSGRSDGQATE